jgi:hypothetical protein
MGHPSYQRSSRSFLWFLLGFILGRWVRRRSDTRNRNPPLGDRLFRAHESWQWTPTVDEEEEEP